MNWIEDLEIDVMEVEGRDNLPSEVLHKWALAACQSFDDLDVAEAGLREKIAQRQEELALVMARKERRRAFIMRYLADMPNKEIVVNGDKFKLVESKATKVEIVDQDLIPTNYCKYTITTDYNGFTQIPDIKLFGDVKIAVDKTKIKADSDNGIGIMGTEIVQIAPSLKRNGKGI